MSYTEEIKIIHKHLSGELSKEEVKDYMAWKVENAENELLADQIENIWESAAEVPQTFFDADKAFAKHLAKMKEAEPTITDASVNEETTIIKQINPSNHNNIFNLTWIKTLAAILVFAIAALFIFDNSKKSSNTITDTFVTLDDGSKVWLNEGSELDIKSFSPNNRIVKLKGKGYFDIKSNLEAPFKISANGFDVQVLGTKFVVNALNREVSVKEGKVKVTNAIANTILTANQKVIVNNKDEMLVENFIFDDSQLWFNEELKFNNAPFDQVIREISANFNVKIILPARNDWSKCTFTSGSLKGNSLDQVLTILKLTYELEYTRLKDNNISLTKVKCK